MEKFSVLMSVYKNDKLPFVIEALDSVVNNSVKPDEIIMTIDGPISDDFLQGLQDYSSIHSELKLVQLEKNVGLGNALNIGLSHCSNEFVARMDSDDVCSLDRFEKQLAFIIEHNFDVCGGAITEFMESPDKPIAKREVPLSKQDIVKFIKTRNPFNHVTVMFKKSKVQDVGGYIEMHYVEDYFLWCRMVLANAQMGNMPDILTFVRVDENMYLRRGGYKYFKSQKALFKFMRKNKMLNFFEYLKTLTMRFVVQVLVPNKLREKIYKKHLRKKK